MAALLERGARYWALGLPAAARSVLQRALAASDDVAPALRLTDIALAQGDAATARRFATEATRRAPGPATRILLGRSQLAAGEVAAARMSLLAALDAPRLVPWERARAHLELARAAEAQGDPSAAAAHANTAFEAALVASRERIDLTLAEEIAALAVAHGRTDDATAAVAAAADAPGSGACAAVLLVARQAAGD
ncbi:MAG: hypothetical protein NT062_16800, partial [Proteobacteria bacterium]|nr:hypothetical protein [Pseudomonadota bacterium]